MSAETLEWLNTNTLVGFAASRGNAWSFREHLQGEESNHYPGAIPAEDVRRRLFGWEIKSTSIVNGDTFDAVPGYQLIYRGDTGAPFGVFSDGYKVHQYWPWLVENVAALVDASAGELGIGSAILLMGGAVAAVQIERPESVLIGGDTLRPFICATTSANGKFATSYKSGTTRVVCDNTLAMFHRNAEGFKVKHSSKSMGRLDDSRRALDITFRHQNDELAEIERLMNESLTDAQFRAIVDQLDPIPADDGRSKTMAETKRGELARLWSTDIRVTPYRGTVWGAVQAYSTYDQHLSIVRGTVRPERAMLNFLNGKTEAADQNVVKVARELIAV